jgi:hypothetical protein
MLGATRRPGVQLQARWGRHSLAGTLIPGSEERDVTIEETFEEVLETSLGS